MKFGTGDQWKLWAWKQKTLRTAIWCMSHSLHTVSSSLFTGGVAAASSNEWNLIKKLCSSKFSSGARGSSLLCSMQKNSIKHFLPRRRYKRQSFFTTHCSDGPQYFDSHVHTTETESHRLDIEILACLIFIFRFCLAKNSPNSQLLISSVSVELTEGFHGIKFAWTVLWAENG